MLQRPVAIVRLTCIRKGKVLCEVFPGIAGFF